MTEFEEFSRQPIALVYNTSSNGSMGLFFRFITTKKNAAFNELRDTSKSDEEPITTVQTTF